MQRAGLHPTLLLLLVLVTGCAPRPRTSQATDDARTARLLASLMDAAERSRRSGLDSASARAAADSVLASEGVTREQFRQEVRALNEDAARWRKVSEEAARNLEQRLAAPGRR